MIQFVSRSAHFAAVLAVLAASFALAAPQQNAGAPRTIVLPPQLEAGARATLSVLDSAGRLVPAVDVQLSGSGNVTTDGTGRAVFVAPPQAGMLTARLAENGLSFTTAVVPTTAGARPASNADAARTLGGKPAAKPPIAFPRTISLHDRFELTGAGFKGDADQNRVILADQLALVLAASPVSLIAIPNPATPLGPAKLVVEIGGLTFDPMPVTVVSLDVSGPTRALAAGEKGILTVLVTGSTDRLLIELRNFSPEIVALNAEGSGAAVQRLITTGGDVNVAKFQLIGVKPGDYSVSARLVSTTVDSPSLENARQHLLAAQHVADAKWRARIDAIVQRIDQGHADVPRIREQIEHLIDGHPQRQVADLLQQAWEVLRYV